MEKENGCNGDVGFIGTIHHFIIFIPLLLCITLNIFTLSLQIGYCHIDCSQIYGNEEVIVTNDVRQACSPWCHLIICLKSDVLKRPVRLGKTPIQVAIRWGMQMGHSMLPKKSNNIYIYILYFLNFLRN